MKRKRNPRLYERYLRTFLPIVLGFLVLIGGILIYYQGLMIFHERAMSESTHNSQIVESVSEYVENLELLITYPYLDSEVLKILRKDYAGENTMLEYTQDNAVVRNKLAVNLYHLRKDLNSVLLISEKTGTIYSAMRGNLRADADYKETDWYQSILMAGHKTVCFGLYHNVLTPSYDTLFGIGKAIIDPQTKEILGVIVINVEERYFRNSWGMNENDGKSGVILFDSRGYRYSSLDGHDDALVEKACQRMMLSTADCTYAWHEGRLYCITKASAETSDWTSIRMTDVSAELYQVMQNVVILLISILILYLVLRHFCRRMALRVTQPLEELNRAMEETSAGNFAVRAKEGDDEIGTLARQFNQMSEHIGMLISRVRFEEREKNNAELMALQSQINPHFLYNTIHTIKIMAELQGASRLASVLEQLSQFLHSCYGMVDELIPVENECVQTRSYLELMSYRYAGRFHYDFEIAESIEKALIPRFILQPLVENAILHGIDLDSTVGRIIIRGRKDGKDILLEVYDNGCGMSEDTILDMLSAQPTKQSVLNVGVSNVIKRIHMLCGEEYGLTVDSRPGEYTSVFIRLPFAVKDKSEK